MEACNEDQIPSHLHQNGRDRIDPLDLTEHDRISIRVKPQDWDTASNRPQVTAFASTSQSCNLKRLCVDVKDVLYDSNCPEKHWKDWGVVSLHCLTLEAQGFIVEGDVGRQYNPLVVHDPLPCNFPHCEIHFLHHHGASPTPVKVFEIKPTSVKLKARQFYRDHCQVEKEPSLPT